jgi:hypothetical protein
MALNSLRKKKDLTLLGLTQVFVACARISARLQKLPPNALAAGQGRAAGAVGMQVEFVVVHEPSDRKCGRPCLKILGLPQIAEDMRACRSFGNAKSNRVQQPNRAVRLSSDTGKLLRG